MGGDGGDAKGPGMLPSPGVQADHRDYGDTWGGQGVGIPLSGDVNGIHGDPPHKGVN